MFEGHQSINELDLEPIMVKVMTKMKDMAGRWSSRSKLLPSTNGICACV
jgi:hypothetical protein